MDGRLKVVNIERSLPATVCCRVTDAEEEWLARRFGGNKSAGLRMLIRKAIEEEREIRDIPAEARTLGEVSYHIRQSRRETIDADRHRLAAIQKLAAVLHWLTGGENHGRAA